MRVFAVVANWNGGEELAVCLESLATLQPQLAGVVLVDNASSDGSVERALAEHPGLFVLRHGENLGYGEACNQGARLALARGAEACLLVNNDAVLLRDTLELLKELSGLISATRRAPRECSRGSGCPP